MNVATAFTAANVILGLLVFVTQGYYFWLFRKKNSWAWIKGLASLVGLWWTIVYLQIAFAPNDWWQTDTWSQFWIRGGITGTLIVFLVCAIFRPYHHNVTGR